MALDQRLSEVEEWEMGEREQQLRRVLSCVDYAKAYERAVKKGTAAGLAAFPDTLPDRQLGVARAVALREFSALVGWDL